MHCLGASKRTAIRSSASLAGYGTFVQLDVPSWVRFCPSLSSAGGPCFGESWLGRAKKVPKEDLPILPHETVPEANMTVEQSREDRAAEPERCVSGLLFFGHRHYCF